MKLTEIDSAEERLAKIEKSLGDNLFGHMSGFDFSLFIQDLLISEGTYIMDTGNWENANYVCAYKLLDKIKKHPLIWKLFFMIS